MPGTPTVQIRVVLEDDGAAAMPEHMRPRRPDRFSTAPSGLRLPKSLTVPPAPAGGITQQLLFDSSSNRVRGNDISTRPVMAAG